MSVDLGAVREAGKSVSLIDQRILSIANRLFNRRLEGLRFGEPRIVDVPVVMGSKGTALAAGAHMFFRLGLGRSATVVTWSLGATVNGLARAGAVALDIQVGATLATVASICGTGKPALAGVSELPEQAPTNWLATTIADPSWFYVTVFSVDGTLEVVSLTLRVAA